MVKRLNTQRNISVDYALIDGADHMYNNHLIDLYKISGHYIIDALKKGGPARKRRGRRRKSEIENETLMLESDVAEEVNDDYDDEVDDFDTEADDFADEE